VRKLTPSGAERREELKKKRRASIA